MSNGIELPIKLWELPELTNINRLPGHCDGVPHHNADSALRYSKENSEYYRKLDGVWQFKLLARPELAAEFLSKDPADSDWDSINVPSNWTLANFWDKPRYTNVQMPFDNNPPIVPQENPTGIYRRRFDIPTAWAGRRVIIHFGGVESYMELYLNGQFVGMSKDTRLPAEFDITKYLQPKTNELTVRVLRWSDGSYLEDQDHWWMAGIFRSVYLYSPARPVCIEDVHVNGDYDYKNRNGNLCVDVKIHIDTDEYFKVPKHNEPFKIKAELFTPEMKPAGVFESSISRFFRRNFYAGKISGQISNPLPWSAENPSIYTVVVQLEDHMGNILDIRGIRTGFRRIEFRHRQMLINGQPVVIHGVNRHEHDEYHGKTISRELMERDIKLLKQLNFNSVRTSHYPNDSLWYDLCDEYGIYVFDEANLESHANYATLCHEPRWKNAFVERCTNMVLRDRNHPSVIAWSLGNETGFGENSVEATDAILRLDSSRAIHNENEIHAQGVDPDVIRLAICNSRGKFGSIQRSPQEWKDDFEKSNFRYNNFANPMYPGLELMKFWANEIDDERPFVMCEYSHSQGNAGGNLKEYFEFLETGKGFQGGFIWDWVDQGIRHKDPDGTEYWLYGGDFGEDIHDSECCINGIVWPDRTPHPAAFEFKKLAQPLRVELADQQNGILRIRNRQCFKDLSWLCGHWDITVDGVMVSSGEMEKLTLAPLDTQEVTLNGYELPSIYEGQCVFLNLSFKSNSHQSWCDAGFEVATEQFPLAVQPTLSCPAKANTLRELKLSQSPEKVEITCGETICTFNRQTGNMQLNHAGKTVILEGPKLNTWRACTSTEGIRSFSNQDSKPMGLWKAAGLDNIQMLECNVTAAAGNREIAVEVSRTWAGTDKSKIIRHVEYYRFDESGRITIKNIFDYDNALPHLPRVGVILTLAENFEYLAWLGRGPIENYIDRNYSAHVGLYKKTVSSEYVPYIVPQEHGNKTDVRWFELSDSAIKIRFAGKSGFEFSASHYYPHDLYRCSHTNELRPHKETVVTIDYKQKGLGTRLFEHDPLTKYQILPGKFELEYEISIK